METDLRIGEDIYLTKSSRSDKAALVAYLNDEELYNQTLRIPSPYIEQDAEDWFTYMFDFEAENNIRKNWVIRDASHDLIGQIGFHFPYGIHSSTCEIYYWLGKPFRNKGILTRVLREFTHYCLTTLKYQRIEVPIFDFNKASEQVLKKCGYTFEGDLPNHYTKAGKMINARIYVHIQPVT